MQNEVSQLVNAASARSATELARHWQALKEELEQLVTQRVAEQELSQARRFAELERALGVAREERAAALQERDAAKEELAALRLRMATVMEQQAAPAPRSDMGLVRQEELLRHVLCTTVDFSNLTVRASVGAGSNGFVLLCDASVPEWCVSRSVPEAAAAGGGGAGRTEVAVAVKVLAGVEDPRHTTLKHRFLREFQTLSDMPPHPNVITLLAFLTKRLPRPMYDLLPDGFHEMIGSPTNPVLALIMPLHPCTLEAAVTSAAAFPAQLVRWCLEVAAAVAHMWAYQWVHLDLKLSNVLVGSDGRAVLTDMGTAMPVAADGSLTVNAHMGLEGNPAHRAPEVLASWEKAQRDRSPLVRIDAGRQEVWALGVLLHEMVAGKHPHGKEYPLGGRGGEAVVDEAALTERGLPAATVAVVRRMVSSDPAARPANPAAAHAELVASVSAAPVPPAPPEVTLRGVEQVYQASKLNLPRDPVTGAVAGPNQSGLQLRAWSEQHAHAAARLLLAMLLWQGESGMQQDWPQARALAQHSIAWCRAAAADGEPIAVWLLGECNLRGMGVEVDIEHAVSLLRQSADMGYPQAQFALGDCYRLGFGVARDAAQAVPWYYRAAEQDHAEAQWILGECYGEGFGVLKDPRQALTWYLRAAEQGHSLAQVLLQSQE